RCWRLPECRAGPNYNLRGSAKVNAPTTVDRLDALFFVPRFCPAQVPAGAEVAVGGPPRARETHPGRPCAPPRQGYTAIGCATRAPTPLDGRHRCRRHPWAAERAAGDLSG